MSSEPVFPVVVGTTDMLVDCIRPQCQMRRWHEPRCPFAVEQKRIERMDALAARVLGPHTRATTYTERFWLAQDFEVVPTVAAVDESGEAVYLEAA